MTESETLAVKHAYELATLAKFPLVRITRAVPQLQGAWKQSLTHPLSATCTATAPLNGTMFVSLAKGEGFFPDIASSNPTVFWGDWNIGFNEHRQQFGVWREMEDYMAGLYRVLNRLATPGVFPFGVRYALPLAVVEAACRNYGMEEQPATFKERMVTCWKSGDFMVLLTPCDDETIITEA